MCPVSVDTSTEDCLPYTEYINGGHNNYPLINFYAIVAKFVLFNGTGGFFDISQYII